MRRSFLVRPGSAAHKRAKGAVLFIAVGAIAILSILTLGVTSSVLQELRLAKTVTEANTSFYNAYSVLSAMNVIWANDAAPAAITLYDLRERRIAFGDRVALVTFSDEEAKINVSNAARDILLRLPGMAGQEILADKIVAARVPVKEELLLIDGMTQEIYDEVKGLITTFGAGTVNINTALPESLSVLGMDADLIAKIIAFRKGQDAIEGTLDDLFFTSSDQIVPSLEPYGLSPEQQALLQGLIAESRIEVKSDHIVLSIALQKAGKTFRFFEIIPNLATGKIMSWSER